MSEKPDGETWHDEPCVTAHDQPKHVLRVPQKRTETARESLAKAMALPEGASWEQIQETLDEWLDRR